MTKRRFQPTYNPEEPNPLIDQIMRRSDTLFVVPLNQIQPDPENPRTTFNDQEIHYLAQDIRTNGLINPIVITPTGAGTYMIVAGERRYRALQINQVTETTALIVEPAEAEAIQTAENIHRTDLTPIEEARMYAKLAAKHNLSIRALAERVNKDRSYVDRRLRILKFPPEVIQFIEDYPNHQHSAARIAEIDDEKERMKALRELRYAMLDPTRAPKPNPQPKTIWTQRKKRDGSTSLTITYHAEDIPEIISRLQGLLQDLSEHANPTDVNEDDTD